MQNVTLHYQLERDEYVLTDEELSKLENGIKTPYRDICLTTAGVCIPSIVNASGYIKDPFVWSLPLFFNAMIGGICFLGAFVLGILWFNNRNTVGKIIKEIRNKPKIDLQVVSTGASASTIIGSATENKNE